MRIHELSGWLEELKSELKTTKKEVEDHRKAKEILLKRKAVILKAESEMNKDGKSVNYLKDNILANVEDLIKKSGVSHRENLEKRDTLEALIESIESDL